MYSTAKKTVQLQRATKTSIQIEMLVEKAICGDMDALNELCEKIMRSILFQVMLILNCSLEDAEDVSQRVLVCVWRNIHRLSSPKAFKRWLTQIIINKKNDYLSEKMRRGIPHNINDYVEKMVDENPNYIPHEYNESNESRSAVMRAISQLPVRQRQTIVLHYFYDMRVTEIAKVMGVRTQSVSKHLAIAREKLKCRLQELAAG